MFYNYYRSTLKTLCGDFLLQRRKRDKNTVKTVFKKTSPKAMKIITSGSFLLAALNKELRD